MVTFLQRTFTSLVHAHAGRTQIVGVRTCGAGTVTLHSFLATYHRPTTKTLCFSSYFTSWILLIMKRNSLLILLLAVISGCTTSSGIMLDGKDSYRVMHTGDTGFTNSNTLQKNAYKEATIYCSSKGKVIETVRMESKQARPLGGWPEASLLFKCVERADET